ncbi:MAG: hypothetical protein ACREAC_02295, partial [Blastocatellia bacterium]
MICILSQDSLEPTTEAVLDWLKSWRIPVVRLNVEDLKNDDLSVAINGKGVVISGRLGDVAFDPEVIKV